MKYVVACATLLALGAIQSESRAHHAFAAEFDADKPIVLRGKITRLRVDQSTFVDPYRGRWQRRHDAEVDGGRRHAQHTHSQRIDAGHFESRHGNHRARLPEQGRTLRAGLQSQWARHHLHRWPQDLHGIERYRCTEGRFRSDRGKR